jgi:hypothetical protein
VSEAGHELWLPAAVLSRCELATLPAGALALAMPGRKFAPASIGLRFDVDDRRLLLALTPFFDGRSPAGCAIDITDAKPSGYVLDAPFAIDADVTASARRYDSEEARIGALVAGPEGAGLVGLFQPSNGFSRRVAVSVTTWERLSVEKLEVEFTSWRLVVTLPDRDPIIFQPFSAPPQGTDGG